MNEKERYKLGDFLERQGMTDDMIDDYFEHHGVKGQKWGVTRNRTAIKSARVEFRAVSKNAGQIIKEGRNATSPEARKAAADRYRKEVLDKIRAPGFKETFRNANTLTKGEVTASLLISNIFAPIQMAVIRSGDKNMDRSYAAEVGVAQEILRELRSA